MKKILFLDFSTKLDTIHDLKSRARGGMVSSLFKVTDALNQDSKFDCYVVSDIKEGGPGFIQTNGDTVWLTKNDEAWIAVQKWDFLVLNRGVGGGYPYINAKHRILWTHDLPHSGFVPEPDCMKAFSGVVFMSRYAEWVWRKFYRTIGRSWFIPNGVDKDLFYPQEKDLNYLIYISAPNRGLKKLPLIFDAAISRLDRPVYLRAFSNMSSLHPNEIRDDQDSFDADYKEVEESNIKLQKPLPQPIIAGELGVAGLMVLPSAYPEICSNSILQSLASGTPVVTTGHLGSAPEWVKHGKNGYLTQFMPHDYMIHSVEMVRGIVEILSDEKKHMKMIENAPRTKGLYTWEEIGKKWKKMLNHLS